MGTDSLRKAGVTVIVFLIAAKTVGVVKEILIAAQFGTSQTVDMYLAGITVPAVLSTLLYQALPNAFVPLFARRAHSSSDKQYTAILLLGILGVISVLVWLFADVLASFTNQGFPPDVRGETVTILKISAATILLVTAESLFRSRLLAKKKFAYTGVSGMMPSTAMIVAVLVYPEGGARTLAWGFVGGATLAALWNMLPFLGRLRRVVEKIMPPAPAKDTRHDGTWTATVVLLGSAGLFYPLIDRYFASFLAEGSIAAIQYANTIATQPLALFGIALGTAVFPYLAQRAAAGDTTEIRLILNKAIRWVLVLSIPFAVWCIIFGEEVVSLLYERGAFDVSSREATGLLLIPYGAWLVPAVLVAVLMKLHYASLRWRAILVATLLGLAVKVVGSFWLVGPWEAQGLVVATAGSRYIIALILLLSIPREYTAGNGAQWLRLGILVAGFSVAGSLCALLVSGVLAITDWTVLAIVRLGLALLITAGLLAGLGPRAGIEEVTRIHQWVAARIWRR